MTQISETVTLGSVNWDTPIGSLDIINGIELICDHQIGTTNTYYAFYLYDGDTLIGQGSGQATNGSRVTQTIGSPTSRWLMSESVRGSSFQDNFKLKFYISNADYDSSVCKIYSIKIKVYYTHMARNEAINRVAVGTVRTAASTRRSIIASPKAVKETNGQTVYGTVPDNAIFDLTGSFAVGFWATQGTDATTSILLNKNYSAYDINLMGSGEARIEINTGATKYKTKNKYFFPYTWRHCIVERNTVANTILFYIDGVLVEGEYIAGSGAGTITANDTDLQMFRRHDGSVFSRPNAGIRELFIINRVLTSAEKLNIVKKAIYPTDVDELWKMDEGTGTVVSGLKGNNMTLAAANWYSTSLPTNARTGL